MDEKRSQRSFFVHEQNLELDVRFETYFATATAEFEKSTSKTKEKFSSSFSIFQTLFPETDCHAKTRLPERRLWQSARPYLLIITTRVPEVCYLSYLSLYLKMAKQAHQHTRSTILTHNARAQKAYTRENVPGRLRHPSLARYTHALNLRTIFLKSTDDG